MRFLFILLGVMCFPAVGLAQDHSMMHHAASGMPGSYSMTREASGTSWQPDATPHGGIHWTAGEWMLMAHGFAQLIYDDQGGGRGDHKIFSSNMLMGMAQRPLGPGTLGARSMLSLEPATIGGKGYPLLLQTGETANGREPLIDRQHPHDLLMELAATYSLPVADHGSAFAYVGMPGEPALGPPTFMHRFSGAEIPEAPITHHWLDSTHVTFGVATLGYVWNQWKAEGSIFTGREPDQDRWDFESPRFDSYAARLSYNPTRNWSLQASYGMLDSPEQLEPQVDMDRTTVSATYHQNWDQHQWQTTLAWGQNKKEPGQTLNAFLLESTVNISAKHTFFGRLEMVEKDELFSENDPQHGRGFWVTKLSLGYLYDFWKWKQLQWGVGALGSVHFLPDDLEGAYDDTPTSFMVFTRIKV